MTISDGMGQPQFDIRQTTAVVCSCGNPTFTHGVFLREISALLSPTGKAGIIPIPTFTCNACGNVPSQTLHPVILEEAMAAAAGTPAPEPDASGPNIKKGNLTLLNEGSID